MSAHLQREPEHHEHEQMPTCAGCLEPLDAGEPVYCGACLEDAEDKAYAAGVGEALAERVLDVERGVLDFGELVALARRVAGDPTPYGDAERPVNPEPCSTQAEGP